jgi:hypothetical protein
MKVTEIHTLWIGELGPLERLCLSSWVRLGHKVVLHAYTQQQAPDGVEVCDAARLLPTDRIFRCSANGSLAVFSDIYRAQILKNFDAVWLDADIFLLRPIDFSAPNILAAEGGDEVRNLNSAVLRLQADHPILEKIIRRYKRPYLGVPWTRPKKAWPVLTRALCSRSLGPEHLPWGALGYGAIQGHVAKFGFDGRILESKLCLTQRNAPIFEAVADPDSHLVEPVAYVHMYRSGLKFDLSIPAARSIYERLSEIVEQPSERFAPAA